MSGANAVGRDVVKTGANRRLIQLRVKYNILCGCEYSSHKT